METYNDILKEFTDFVDSYIQENKPSNDGTIYGMSLTVESANDRIAEANKIFTAKANELICNVDLDDETFEKLNAEIVKIVQDRIAAIAI